MTIQVARPASDDQAGKWTPVPLYPHVNGVTANDNSPIASSVNPVADLCEVKLQGLAWPSPGTETLTVRLAGDGATDATVVLLQGSNPIAAATFTPPASFANYTLTLTDAQVAQISDYTALHVEVIAGDVLVSCCPNALPAILHVTVANGSGCSCMAGTFPLVWFGGQWTWTGPDCLGGQTYTIALKCGLFNRWLLTIGCGADEPIGLFAAAGSTCSPLHLIFNGFGFSSCCQGTLNATVTT